MGYRNPISIILAGKDSDQHILGGEHDKPSKFFMGFGNGIVGDMIVNALDPISRSIYVVGPEPYISDYKFETSHPLYLLAQGKTRTENIMRAVSEAERIGNYREGEHVLLVMGDLPLLTIEAIEEFISSCENSVYADLYIGMIPKRFVDQCLLGVYQNDFLPVNGGYLHSDVYLLRPNSITEKGMDLIEKISGIRRLDRENLHEVFNTSYLILRTLGLRGLLTFARILAGLAFYKLGRQDISNLVTTGIESEVSEIIQRSFGPKVRFVTLDQPYLAYEFDHVQQLTELERFYEEGNLYKK